MPTIGDTPVGSFGQRPAVKGRLFGKGSPGQPHRLWLALLPLGYPTLSNSWESETPSARARRNRFLKEGFRRAVSIPPKYVRCIWANSTRRSWDSPHSPSGCRVAAIQRSELGLRRRHPALTPGLSTCCDGRREHREDVQDSSQKGAGRGL